MPHLIVEYSANIEDQIALDALLDKLHTCALGTGVFPLDVQQRAAEELFAVLTKHLEPLYAKSPLALSLNVQEFHPVLNFKKNNLHEHVKRRAPKP